MTARTANDNLAAGGTQPVEVPAAKTRLQRLRLPLMLLAPALVLAGAVYRYVYGGRYESTDDAYTQAATVSISANVSARVTEVAVHDNEIVQRGAVLFRLDDAPFHIALSEAEASLSSARLRINALKSTYRQRQTELRAARETLAYEQQQYDRSDRLLKTGIVSRAQFDLATHALENTREQLAGAMQQVDAVAADLAGNPGHPARPASRRAAGAGRARPRAAESLVYGDHRTQ